MIERTTNLGFDTYNKYLAVKLHFTPPTKKGGGYDYFRYGGKLKTVRANYDSLPGVWMFEKLAKHFPDRAELELFLAANAYTSIKGWWVGKLLSPEAEAIYQPFQKRKDSRLYWFKSDLEAIRDSSVKEVVSRVKRGELAPDTLIIFDLLRPGQFDIWSRSIFKEDTLIWPSLKFRLNKLAPFLGISDLAELKETL